MLTKDQAVQRIAALLVDDQELNDYINAKIAKDSPLLVVEDRDEFTESLFYSEQNSIMVTLACEAIGSLRLIKD